MTKEEFNLFWTTSYPDTIPISHLFKQDYSGRWLRIHSLPESKRYAGSGEEWDILLKRQNQIITDLFADDSNILLVTGEYNWDERTTFITDKEDVFKPYHFVRLDNIGLFKVNSEDYDEGEIYRPAFAETIWSLNRHDKLLKEIANNNVRAFFISIDKNLIVAPYDGGIDFIFKDNHSREKYKEKYKKWLSDREDGL